MATIVRLKGIKKTTRELADGTTRTHYYHRASKTPLPGEPGTDAFMAAWHATEHASRLQRAGTVGGLIHDYCQSADWTALAETTRETKRIFLKSVENQFGTMPLAALDEKGCKAEFLEWRDAVAKKHPRVADARLSALASVLSWALDRGKTAANPLSTFKRVYRSNRSEKIWLPSHVTRFEAVASPELVLAMTVALHTGQRQGDLLRLTWKAYDGEALTLIQSKGRRQVYIPCTEALKVTLDGLTRSKTLYVLTRPGGQAWTKDAFKQAWRAAFVKSKINTDLHFHDLRGTAVTMLSEAGCTPQEIATITGHTLAHVEKILDVYLARTKVLARSAIAKLNEHRRNKVGNGVGNGIPPKGAK